MRSLILAVTLSVALPLCAANIWFEPANPDSNTPVIAHVTAATPCAAPATAAVHGRIVSITLPLNDVPKLCATTVNLGVLPAGVYDVVAGPEHLTIGLAEGWLTVTEANPPFTVTPNVANPGETVTLAGPGIAPVCGIAPCPVVVKFGEKEAEVEKQTGTDTLQVRVPDNGSGTVDVSVSVVQTLRAAAAFHYKTGADVDLAFFEPVLFPVIISGPGAFGSQWKTETTLRNENDFPLTTATGSLFEVACFPICDPRTQPHITARGFDNLPNGFLMWVPRTAAPRLFFSTLVKDMSRQSEALGTEIPVVREKDFFGRPFQILNVPGDARYRVALRVYRLDSGASVRLRVFPLLTGPALVDTTMSLGPAGTAYTIGYIGDLLTQFPVLSGKDALRIEIDPESDQPATWGFVSVTNNQTQHVTVISPH